MSEASAKIDGIIKRYAPEWLMLPGVFGVAEGRTPEGRPCVLVLVPLVQRCQKPAPRPTVVDSTHISERIPSENEQRMSEASAKIDGIIKRHAPEWLMLPGVFGVAEGRTPEGRPCVLVLVQDRTKTPRIPDEIEGIPVRFDETDSIRAFGLDFKPEL